MVNNQRLCDTHSSLGLSKLINDKKSQLVITSNEKKAKKTTIDYFKYPKCTIYTTHTHTLVQRCILLWNEKVSARPKITSYSSIWLSSTSGDFHWLFHKISIGHLLQFFLQNSSSYFSSKKIVASTNHHHHHHNYPSNQVCVMLFMEIFPSLSLVLFLWMDPILNKRMVKSVSVIQSLQCVCVENVWIAIQAIF